MLLSVEDLHVYYGEAIHALRGVTFAVPAGEIVAIIGANGAGKSTLMWTLAGLLKPRSGKITLNGAALPAQPHRAVELGIALVPERRRLFANLTVRENLGLGAYLRSNRQAIAEDEGYVFALFPVLKQRFRQYAGTLSGGEQQMLAIGRALMSRPKLLLLDEPSLGLAPVLANQVFTVCQEISRQGMTILLVEQNAFKALEIAQHAYVLETGLIVLSGEAGEMLRNPAVQAAYLGIRQRKDVVLGER
jgi:branched-chain amino acid transport system ATP-binding protein